MRAGGGGGQEDGEGNVSCFLRGVVTGQLHHSPESAGMLCHPCHMKGEKVSDPMPNVDALLSIHTHTTH